MQIYFARYISYIFEPFTFSFFTLILIVNSLDVGLTAKAFWLVLGIVIMGLPPIAVYFYEKKIGKIKDWFMTNRAERRDVQFAWFFGSLGFSLLARYLDAPRQLLAIGLVLLILSLVVTVVNFYWKISVHMVGVSLFAMVAVLVYSSAFAWLLGLIVLVGWARIRLGAHTFLQASLGTLLTILVVFSVFAFFGLATF